jgi:hypothetical protein
MGHVSQGRFGFDHVIHCAGLDRLDRCLFVAMTGHHHSRISRGVFITRQQFQTSPIGQQQIDDREIGHSGR